jgi:hypothetical protein
LEKSDWSTSIWRIFACVCIRVLKFEHACFRNFVVLTLRRLCASAGGKVGHGNIILETIAPKRGYGRSRV